MRIFLTGFFIVCLAVLSFIILDTPPKANKHVESSRGEAAIGGDFTLTNQHGKVMHDADFRGKVMVVFFGFTHCPMICPVSVATVSSALERLGDDAQHIAPIFITVDPQRDTPQVMKEFLSPFDSRFVGLSGTQEQTQQVLEAYKAYAKKGEPMDKNAPDSYMVDHSSYIYVMNQQGGFEVILPYDTEPDKLADAISQLTMEEPQE